MAGALLDATLREGEQTFGVYFSPRTKRDILRGLMQAGVDEAELGCVGAEDLAGLLAWAKALRTQHGGERPMRLSVWCRLHPDDLRMAAALAPDAVNVGVPVSDNHMHKRLRTDRAGVLARLRSGLARAAELGLERISVGLEDCSRADLDFALEVARTAAACGAFRVRISDTVGILSPLQAADLVTRFRAAVGPDVEIGTHFHNDCGMATANAVTALDAGADSADCCVLGLGERAGVARLEELAGHLELVRQKGRYDIAAIIETTRLTARATKTDIPPARPLLGNRIFAVESGLHVDGVAKDPTLFEPYAPASVGTARVLALGKKSGRNAVQRRLEELGLDVDGEAAAGLAEKVREESARVGRPLDDGEVKGLAVG